MYEFGRGCVGGRVFVLVKGCIGGCVRALANGFTGESAVH